MGWASRLQCMSQIEISVMCIKQYLGPLIDEWHAYFGEVTISLSYEIRLVVFYAL